MVAVGNDDVFFGGGSCGKVLLKAFEETGNIVISLDLEFGDFQRYVGFGDVDFWAVGVEEWASGNRISFDDPFGADDAFGPTGEFGDGGPGDQGLDVRIFCRHADGNGPAKAQAKHADFRVAVFARPGDDLMEIGDFGVGGSLVKAAFAIAGAPEIETQGGNTRFGEGTRGLDEEATGLAFGPGEAVSQDDQFLGIGLVENGCEIAARGLDEERFFHGGSDFRLFHFLAGAF